MIDVILLVVVSLLFAVDLNLSIQNKYEKFTLVLDGVILGILLMYLLGKVLHFF